MIKTLLTTAALAAATLATSTSAFADRGDYHNGRGGYDRGSHYESRDSGRRDYGYRGDSGYRGGDYGRSRSSFGFSFGYSNYGGYDGTSFGFGVNRGYSYAPRYYAPAPLYVPAPRVYVPAPRIYVSPPPVYVPPYYGGYYGSGYRYDGGGYYCR